MPVRKSMLQVKQEEQQKKLRDDGNKSEKSKKKIASKNTGGGGRWGTGSGEVALSKQSHNREGESTQDKTDELILHDDKKKFIPPTAHENDCESDKDRLQQPLVCHTAD